VSTDPSKIKVVKEWPVPEGVHEVPSFLGLASYYRRFVPTFSEIAAPLHAATVKNKAFTKLKYALISSPILAMPNDTDTDACVSIGAVLSQVQSGVERVIAYASRSFSNIGKVAKDTWQIVPPVEYLEESMQTVHAPMMAGHMGVKKTQKNVAKRAYWVGWTRNVRDFCRKCDICSKYHCGTVRKQGELQNMCVGAPWERVAIDVTGLHPQQRY